MKKLLPYIALTLSIIAFFFAVKSCGGPDPAYWVKKAIYTQLAKDTEAQHALDLSTIVAQTEHIAQRDEHIAAVSADIENKRGEIATLKATLHGLRETEPQTTPEVESLPIVINLRAQIGNLTNTLSISYEIIDNKDKVIADWTGKFNAQATISETWKRSYENEHRLRLVSEALNNELERKARAGRFYGKLTTAGLAVAGAYLIINAIAK